MFCQHSESDRPAGPGEVHACGGRRDPEACGGLIDGVALQIDEGEDVTLPTGERAVIIGNESCHTFAGFSRRLLRVSDSARIGEPCQQCRPPVHQSTAVLCRVVRHPIQPADESSGVVHLAHPIVQTKQHILCDVFRLVRIAGQPSSPGPNPVADTAGETGEFGRTRVDRPETVIEVGNQALQSGHTVRTG